ncbi:hypothetical protein DPX39_110025900 [Trypanosoma brucei equiperdum]|uniref:Uncharacterized protein n=1 Tax=Trypanosoma brucei equiperdum TaxID=630700 RepID=A0A3L6KT19_9TRYP|nr:hypothetical protein DPX39_110025900 [Trypanosoma brucei equiperdum]
MVDRIEATLNRLIAFGPGTASYTDDAAFLQNVASAMEVAGEIPVLTEACMSLSVDLLENSSPRSAATHAVLTLLACCCMRDDNRELASRFGIFSLCVLLLRSSELLCKDTLLTIFDLIGTLCMSSASTRQMMRPCIPYVLGVMRTHPDCFQLCFSGAVVIGTLVMLDAANAELAAENDCVQILLTAFMRGHDKRKELLNRRRTSYSLRCQREEDESRRLCDNVIRWTEDALQKLVLAPSPVIDAKLEAADFGNYGDRVEVDELMWKLKFGRGKM